MLLSSIDSCKATLDLINQVERQGLKYVSVDIKRNNRIACEKVQTIGKLTAKRDQHMVDKISQVCDTHKTGAVLLVGLNHLGIESKLRDKGFNVISFYTPGIAPAYAKDASSSLQKSDHEVRNGVTKIAGKYLNSINVIDVSQNPYLDPVKTCRELMQKFFSNKKSPSLQKSSSDIKGDGAIAIVQQAIDCKKDEGLSCGGSAATSMSNQHGIQCNYKAVIVGMCGILCVVGAYLCSQFSNSEMGR